MIGTANILLFMQLVIFIFQVKSNGTSWEVFGVKNTYRSIISINQTKKQINAIKMIYAFL